MVVGVVSSIPTGVNFFLSFFDFEVTCQFGAKVSEMSGLCYLGKT